jgi:hypothetical protein
MDAASGGDGNWSAAASWLGKARGAAGIGTIDASSSGASLEIRGAGKRLRGARSRRILCIQI